MFVTVTAQSASEVEADGLIACVAEGVTEPTGALAALDKAAGGVIKQVLADPSFGGKDGKVEVLYPLAGARAKRLVLVGLGKEKPTAEALRQAIAAGVGALRDKATNVAILLPEVLPAAEATTAVAEAGALAAYRFKGYHSKQEDADRRIERVVVVGGDPAAADAAMALANAVNWVRDLSNMPGNLLNVPELASRAEAFAKEGGLTVKRLDAAALAREGLNCLLGVGRGSDDPPQLLIAEYRGAGADVAPIALVGKGVTFDTGGVCIKPRAGMEEMKTDMHGAATVLATMRMAAARKLPMNLVALLPIAENMPNGDAYKPGDILKAYNGINVEVLDTDAEGRLILADAIAYAVKNYRPSTVVDVATLTGSIIMALGYEASGLFSNDDALSKELLAAGNATGERLWRMPTWDSYNENIRSDIADVRHIAKAKGADATNAAMFLKRFVDGTPWAHLDIAGPSWLLEGKHYHPKGATGVGVRMLLAWLEARAKA